MGILYCQLNVRSQRNCRGGLLNTCSSSQHFSPHPLPSASLAQGLALNSLSPAILSSIEAALGSWSSLLTLFLFRPDLFTTHLSLDCSKPLSSSTLRNRHTLVFIHSVGLGITYILGDCLGTSQCMSVRKFPKSEEDPARMRAAPSHGLESRMEWKLS